MAYEKLNLINGETLKAEHLQHIENGIAANADALEDKIDSNELTEAINTSLAQAKESGEFDGAPGKSAYAFAKDGGYTGTEAEFAQKLAWLMTLEDGNGVAY